MPKPNRDQAGADSYVECADCGHPLERHTVSGCDWQTDGCECNSPWTVREIGEQRRAAGLPVRFKSWNY